MRKKVKVLLIEENELIQNSLARGISGNGQFVISGIATKESEAMTHIAKETPDVLVINVKLQQMDGVDFFKTLITSSPIPTVVLCDHTYQSKHQALKALKMGAVDFVQIPQIKSYKQIDEVITELKEKVILASMVQLDHLKPNNREKTNYSLNNKAIVIGTSSGSVEAIRTLLDNLPSGLPPILIAQHVPEFSTRSYAELLNKLYPPYVKVAKDQDLLLPNQVLFAPTGKQTRIIKNSDNELQVDVCYQKMDYNPSIEVLMESAANTTGSNGIGIILSNMSDDGANGLRSMRKAGAKTIALAGTTHSYNISGDSQQCEGETILPADKVGEHLLNLIAS